MDEEDFLAAVEADNAAIVPTEEPEVETPKVEETEAPAEPVQAPEALTEPPTPTEPPVVPEAPKQPDPGFVPIGAMLDTRDKLKAAEAELARYRQAAAQQQQQQEVPDPVEDPEGFAQYQREAMQAAVIESKLDISEDLAREKHGNELVDTVQTWLMGRLQQDPAYRNTVLRQRNPYNFMVSEYQREQIATQVTPDDFEQFKAWKTAQGQLQQQAAPAAPPNEAPAIPPRSLASAPSAGGINTQIVQSDEEIFAETFK